MPDHLLLGKMKFRFTPIRESEHSMNKLLAFLLTLVCAAAVAQSTDVAAPRGLQITAEPTGVKLGLGVDVGQQTQNVGLRIDSRSWSFNLVIPQVLTSTSLPLSGVGASWNFSPASSLGLNYRLETNLLPDAPASRSLGLSYGYQFTSGLRLSTNLGHGLSDTAPRWGAGLSLSFSH